MHHFKKIISFFLLVSLCFLSACNGNKFGDARKSPADPAERVKKNLEEGKGFQLKNINKTSSTNYEFASSNPLWRASLDIIDFMPLTTANYSGGIIVTDWYSEEESTDEAIKISIRFLTNEIRSDAIDIKVFNKTCKSFGECSVSENDGKIKTDLTAEILKKATLLEEADKNKKTQ